MKKLYVLYDHACGLCVHAARWLRDEPKYLELEPMPAMSQRAWELFPFVRDLPAPPGEVLVVTDEGALYRGPDAWIMCLYALKRHRGLSIKLAQPRWRPLVSKVIQLLANHRIGISHLLALPAERVDQALLFAPDAPGCAGGACGVPGGGALHGR